MRTLRATRYMLRALVMAAVAGLIGTLVPRPVAGTDASSAARMAVAFFHLDPGSLLVWGPGQFAADGFVNVPFSDPECPNHPDSMFVVVMHNYGQSGEYGALAGTTTYMCDGSMKPETFSGSGPWATCLNDSGCPPLGSPPGYLSNCFDTSSQPGAQCS